MDQFQKTLCVGWSKPATPLAYNDSIREFL